MQVQQHPSPNGCQRYGNLACRSYCIDRTFALIFIIRFREIRPRANTHMARVPVGRTRLSSCCSQKYLKSKIVFLFLRTRYAIVRMLFHARRIHGNRFVFRLETDRLHATTSSFRKNICVYSAKNGDH